MTYHDAMKTVRPRGVTVFFRRLAPVLGLGLALAAGCAGVQLPIAEVSAPGEALFNGRVKPDVDCYRCHNGDASGTWRGPNLAKRVPKLTDAEIARAIAEGPGLMPSFKGKVTDTEAAEITAWLRGKFPR
jgi:mono/diheme cytochrome c family protein